MSVSFDLSDFFDYYVSAGSDVNLYSDIIDQVAPNNNDIYHRDFFYESIRLKQEFASEQANRIEPTPVRGELLPHQRFMARFLSPYTPYNRILAFHGMGTGKTCLYVGVAEMAKKVNPGLRKTIILVRNPTLRNVALNEVLNKCTPSGKYKFEDVSENVRVRPSKDGKTAKKLKPQTMELRRMAKAIESNYEIMTYTQMARIVSDLQTEAAIQEQFDNCYIVIDEAHNLKKGLMAAAGAGGKKKPSGAEEEEKQTEFMEAMQRVLRTTTSAQELSGAPKTVRVRKYVNKYTEIFRLLHVVKGCKIMLLTGTPMRDKVDELCDLLNLILPLNKQLSTKIIQDLYNNEGEINEAKGQEFAKRYLYGNISFLRSMQSITATYKGQIVPPLQKNNVYPLQLVDYQNAGYQEAFAADIKNRKVIATEDSEAEQEEQEEQDEELSEESGDAGAKEDDEKMLSWNNSRFASMFVYPPTEDKGISWGIENESYFEEYFDKEGTRVYRRDKKLIQKVKLSKPLQEYLDESGTSVEERLSQLNNLSNKYAFIIQDLLSVENRNKKAFVYIRFGGGGGALMFSALLDYFGWTRMGETAPTTKAKRYIILTGFTTDAALNKTLIDIYNHPDNKYGEYCQIVIGSHVIGEGVSFLSVRKTYVVTPWFNDATTDQAIARSIRSFSHDQLPVADQTIDIYKLVSMTPEEQEQPIQSFSAVLSDYSKELEVFSVDLYLYDLAEKKDIRIKQMERLMKFMAIDCSLNRARNVPVDSQGQLIFKAGSKECDYMQNCDYDCYGVPRELYSYEGPVYISDTYNFYYAGVEMQHLQEIISVLFELKSAYDFKEMYGMLVSVNPGLNSIVLARALADMIQTNKRVRNRHGFLCLLRTDRDMYFLVDDPLAGEHYTSAYYADMPYPKLSINNYDKIYEKVVNERLADILRQLEQNVKNPKLFKTILSVIPTIILNKLLQSRWIQTRMLQARGQLVSDMNQKLDRMFKSQFDEYEFNGQNYVIHTVPKDSYEQTEDDYYYIKLPFDPSQSFQKLANEDLKNDFANKRKIIKLGQRSQFLLNNPYGYYALKTADEETNDLFLKQIKTPKIKEEDGTLDISKEGRLEGGTKCGTGNFNTAGVLKMLLDLIYRENQLSDIDPDMETYYPFESLVLSGQPCEECAGNKAEILPIFDSLNPQDTTSLGARMVAFIRLAKANNLMEFNRNYGLKKFIIELLTYLMGKPEDKNYWNDYVKPGLFTIYLQEQLQQKLYDPEFKIPEQRKYQPINVGRKAPKMKSYLEEDEKFVDKHPEFKPYYDFLNLIKSKIGDKAKARLKLIDYHPEVRNFLLSESSIQELLTSDKNAEVPRYLGLINAQTSIVQASKQVWAELIRLPVNLFTDVDFTGKSGSEADWNQWITQKAKDWNFVPFLVVAFLMHGHQKKHTGKSHVLTVGDLCAHLSDWFEAKELIDLKQTSL
jgi:hypothetical protein